MFRFLLLSSVCGVFAVPAFAATQTPTVVVTANRVAVPKDQVGSSVSVISRAEIEKSGVTNAYDLLKKTPGITVSRTGGVGAISNVRIRGSNPGQVRVLIDGVFMGDPSNVNNDFDFNSIQLENIERIEILRGPQGALYGTDAMGGVINIITRRGEGPTRYHALAEVGSYDTFRQAAGFDGSQGDWNYALNIQNYETQGFSRNEIGTEDDGARDRVISASLGWKASDMLRFDASGYASKLHADFDPAALRDGPAELDRTLLSGRAAATLSTLDNRWQHVLSVHGSQTDRENDQPMTSSGATNNNRYNDFKGSQSTLEYQSNLALRKRDIVTLGVLTEEQKGEQIRTNLSQVVSRIFANDFRTNSAYGQYLFALNDDITVTVGGRHDDHSKFGGANTYRGTLAYALPDSDTLLRASVGTGFKAPTIYQLYGPFGANPNLKPEKSTGYDAGIEQYFLGKDLRVEFTGFYNEYKDLVDYTTGYVNLDKAKTYGAESAANYQFTPEWSFHLTHTYLMAEDTITNATLLRRPKHSFLAGAQYEVVGKGRFGADLRYVANQKDINNSNFSTTNNQSFTVVDLNAAYQLAPSYELYSRVENLFDKDYQEVLDYNAPGMSVYVGVRAEY